MFDCNKYRYNCKNKLGKNTSEHPLIDENRSSLYLEIFVKKFSDNDPIMTGHVINGNEILPASAQLEMISFTAKKAL